MGAVVLETERLIIETVTTEDAAFYHELYQTPEWIRFVGKRDLPTVRDVEQQLQAGLLAAFAETGFGYYLVRNRAGEAMGTCGFMKKQFLENYDFGFAFLPRYFRQGFGFEAGAAILEYGIKHFAFRRVDAVTIEENVASRRLLEKLGFEFQKVIVEPGTDTQLMLFRFDPLETS